jgi:hypothetical protein
MAFCPRASCPRASAMVRARPDRQRPARRHALYAVSRRPASTTPPGATSGVTSRSIRAVCPLSRRPADRLSPACAKGRLAAVAERVAIPALADSVDAATLKHGWVGGDLGLPNRGEPEALSPRSARPQLRRHAAGAPKVQRCWIVRGLMSNYVGSKTRTNDREDCRCDSIAFTATFHAERSRVC